MAKYLAYQIYIGNIDYDKAIEAYLTLKEEIDQCIAEFENQNI